MIHDGDGRAHNRRWFGSRKPAARMAAGLGVVALALGVAACGSGSSGSQSAQQGSEQSASSSAASGSAASGSSSSSGTSGSSTSGTSGSTSGSSASGNGEFVIATVESLTGDFSTIGHAETNGLKVAVDDVNAMGGILGKHVTLKVVDDGSEASKTLLAAKKVESEGHVDLLVPNPISSLALVTVPYTTQNKILTMNGSSAAALGDPTKYPYNFTFGEAINERSTAVSQAVSQAVPGAKIGLIYSDTTAQAAFGEGVIKYAPTIGLTIAKSISLNGNPTDLTSQLASVRAAGANVVVFDSEYNATINVLMKGMQSLAWDAPVYVPPEPVSGSLDKQVPSSVADQFHAILSRVAIKPSEDKVTDFVHKLAKLGPIDAAPLSATQYDVVMTAKWAYETSQKKYGKTDAESVTKVLESIGSADYPKDYNVIWTPKAPFTAKSHNMIPFDYANFYGIVGASAIVDGQYTGKPLTLKD